MLNYEFDVLMNFTEWLFVFCCHKDKLKRIDLTSNGISRIDDDAFFGLPALEELILRENSIRQLPALPPSMTLIDACHNQLGNTGIQSEAFKVREAIRVKMEFNKA